MPMVYIDVLYFLSIQLVEALLSEVTEPSTDICFIDQIRNDVVIWDKIVRRKEDANISIAGRNKYVFRELSSSFR